MDEKGLGMRLQNARKAAGYTQQQLCQESGLSYSTLAKIERGAIKSPSIFTIQQIAAALHTTVDVLIGAAPAGTDGKKTSKSGVSFVYFDVNGCLVHWYQRAFSMIASDTGISSDIVEDTYLRYNSAVCRGNMSMEEFNAAMANCFEVDDFDWAQYYLGAISSIGPAAELLHWTAKHYEVGLLTNIMPGLLSIMRAQGLLPDIDYHSVIDSSVVGAIKPEPAIYEYAAAEAGVPAQNILLIDDTPSNLDRAQRLGWQVLHFDDQNPAQSIARIREALQF